MSISNMIVMTIECFEIAIIRKQIVGDFVPHTVNQTNLKNSVILVMTLDD
jgi:hypothetical protein